MFNGTAEWEFVRLFIKPVGIYNFTVVVLDFELGNPLDFASSFVTNVNYWVRLFAFYRKLFIDVTFVAFAAQKSVGVYSIWNSKFVDVFLLVAQNCKSFFCRGFKVFVFVCGFGAVVISGGADATLHAFEAKLDRAFFNATVSDE